MREETATAGSPTDVERHFAALNPLENQMTANPKTVVVPTQADRDAYEDDLEERGVPVAERPTIIVKDTPDAKGVMAALDKASVVQMLIQAEELGLKFMKLLKSLSDRCGNDEGVVKTVALMLGRLETFSYKVDDARRACRHENVAGHSAAAKIERYKQHFGLDQRGVNRTVLGASDVTSGLEGVQ